MLGRRDLLQRGAIVVATLGIPSLGLAGAALAAQINRSEDEWRKLLTPEQYSVLREAATESAFSSPLNHEKRPGRFSCAGCDSPLFSSTTKFDSGTGWPSFWAPLADAVTTQQDTSFLMMRTAVNCRRCAGHLGHVFDDGPRPTGLRYCMNGVALKFAPGAA